MARQFDYDAVSNTWDTKYVTVSNTWAIKDTVTSYFTNCTLCTGKKFYTAAGTDGMDKFHLCGGDEDVDGGGCSGGV